jgi:hypothetical protein
MFLISALYIYIYMNDFLSIVREKLIITSATINLNKVT